MGASAPKQKHCKLPVALTSTLSGSSLNLLSHTLPTMRFPGNTIYFDQHDPNSEKRGEGQRRSLAGLDYSPLPRVTGRSLWMGILVSMGGLMYVAFY